MITTSTTFVLGAGASMPYQFPSGQTLRDWICDNRSGYFSAVCSAMGAEEREFEQFTRTFQRSKIDSIDAFLWRRPEFNTFGKFAIAANLCAIERRELVDAAGVELDWYRLLWNRMVADTKQAEEVRGNRVRFITFNYDRSLEFFLFDACKHTYGVQDDVALKIVSSFGILHVYGMLGEFHYVGDGQSTRVFDHEWNPVSLQIAARGIQLMPEERGGDKVFQLARRWMADSDKVCFLGFGFDQINCENLGLDNVLQARKSVAKVPSVYATTKGLIGQEVAVAQKRACGDHAWAHRTADSVVTLRELGILT